MTKNNYDLKKGISVVIPMYNCEQFVPGVLEMFSEQSFKNFEVICVIDGATDGTEDAVRRYCGTDERFSCVTRENGGAGAARNTGLETAGGKYVIFPDADDVYDADYLRKLYNAAESQGADIAVCRSETFDYSVGEKRRIESFNKRVLKEKKVYSLKNKEHLLSMIDVQVANKLFSLDYINSAAISFSETPASNDLFFSKTAVAGAERIVVVHDKLLTIRRFINPDSISSNRGKHVSHALRELQKIYDWLNDHDLLRYCMEDYFALFDGTVNYEMKNGIDPAFAEEMAYMLKCSEPWIGMSAEQKKRALSMSMGNRGMEAEKPLRKIYSAGKISRIKSRNEIIKRRNENKRLMQEMVRNSLSEQL